MANRIFYQEDCNLVDYWKVRPLQLSVTAARDMHMH